MVRRPVFIEPAEPDQPDLTNPKDLVGVKKPPIHLVPPTALIRMVDRHEATGEKVSVRQGFRLGWSRAALPLWLLKQ